MMRKQVVFIMTDTQRTDMISCYENKGLETPNIDSLAENGIKYTRAYTCQPVCGPARSGIFTGTFPHSNGSWANSMAVYENIVNVGRRIRDEDIPCAYIGKWHLDGGDYFGKGICPDYFEDKYWYDMRRYLMELTEEERVNSRRPDYAREKDLDINFCYGHRVSNRALEFLDEYRDQDFYLAVSYDEPHHPYLAPPEFAHKYDDYVFPNSPNVYDNLSQKPEHQKLWAGDNLHADRRKLVQRYPEYFGCHAFADYEIGRVLEKVRELAPDALIIFTSDHGDMLESHRLTGKGPVAYEEVAHIPLIISGAGLKGEREYSMPVSHIDLTPTVCDYFGIEIPQALEGKSLLPTLKDQDVRIHDCVFTEFGRFELDHDVYGGFQCYRAVISDRYKLVINLLSSDEFYDLEDDPYEMHNLIDDPLYYNIIVEHHDRIIDWMNDTRDPFRSYYWERRPWRRDGGRRANWSFTGCARHRIESARYEPLQLEYENGLPIKSTVVPKKMWYSRWRDK